MRTETGERDVVSVYTALVRAWQSVMQLFISTWAETAQKLRRLGSKADDLASPL